MMSKALDPAFGMPSKLIDKVIGKTVTKDIIRGTPVKEDLFN